MNRNSVFRILQFIALLAPIALSFSVSVQAQGARDLPSVPVSHLYIGDSHTVGRFGRMLDARLRQLPDATVAGYASCGSAPHSWYNDWVTTCGWAERAADGKSQGGTRGPTPRLQSLLQVHRPKTLVVALGANLMGFGMDWIRNTTSRMVETIRASGAKCFWIGPPHGRNKTEPKFSQLVTELERLTQGVCEFVDSRPITEYPAAGGDGAHFDGLPAAVRDPILERWVSGVMRPISAGQP